MSDERQGGGQGGGGGRGGGMLNLTMRGYDSSLSLQYRDDEIITNLERLHHGEEWMDDDDDDDERTRGSGCSGGSSNRNCVGERTFGFKDLIEMNYSRGKRMSRRLALVGLIILCVVGIVFMIKERNGDGDDSPNSGGNISGNNMKQDLSPPPQDLSSTCSLTSLNTTEGYAACYDICSTASCCWYPPNNILSCMEENDNVCAIYDEACFNMEMDIPIPPPTLHSLCSPLSLATLEGYHQCESTCAHAKCCTDTTNDQRTPLFVSQQRRHEKCGIVTNPHICSHYNEPCSVLNGNPSTHPNSVSFQVQTSCTTTSLTTAGGLEECIDICAPAACCFVPSSSGTKVDATTTTTTTTNFNAADNRFIAAVSSQTSSCLTTDSFDWCAQYGPCNILFHVHATEAEGGGGGGGSSSSGTTKKENSQDGKHVIDSICNDTSTVDSFLECTAVCFPAYCCFDRRRLVDDGNDDNCDAIKNIDCSHYGACAKLHLHKEEEEGEKDEETAGEPPSHVDLAEMMRMAEHVLQTCSVSNLDTSSGWDDCQALCTHKECCFKDSIITMLGGASDHVQCDQSAHPSMEECVIYASCENYFQRQYSNDGNEKGDGINRSNAMRVAEHVVEKCSQWNLVTPAGRMECETVCNDKLCCFEDLIIMSEGGSMYDMKCNQDVPSEEECVVYASCENLVRRQIDDEFNEGDRI